MMSPKPPEGSVLEETVNILTIMKYANQTFRGRMLEKWMAGRWKIEAPPLQIKSWRKRTKEKATCRDRAK